MDLVLNAALSFPAVIFTVLMGFLVLFWSAVIMGGADPHALDPDIHHVDFDGHVHVDAHVHVDGHVDADHGGHGDGHAHGNSWFAAIAAFLNLGSVPLSMVASAGVIFGWVSSMMLQLYVSPVLATMMPVVAAGTVVLLVAGIVSMISAGLVTRPLRGAFVIQTFEAGEKLIDHVCKVTSSRVVSDFGEARYEMKGAPLVLLVRCRRENKLVRGAEAVIIGYDAKTNIYEIGELDPLDKKNSDSITESELEGKH